MRRFLFCVYNFGNAYVCIAEFFLESGKAHKGNGARVYKFIT